MEKMKACRVPVSQWFIEPRGDVAYSNQVIARELGNPDLLAVEMKDNHEKRRNVWVCTYAQAQSLWRSRGTLGISFDLWGRERNWGAIQFKTFLLARE